MTTMEITFDYGDKNQLDDVLRKYFYESPVESLYVDGRHRQDRGSFWSGKSIPTPWYPGDWDWVICDAKGRSIGTMNYLFTPNGHLLKIDYQNDYESSVSRLLEGIRQKLQDLGFEVLSESDVDKPQNIKKQRKKGKRGPNARTQFRFSVFSLLKEVHPTWSQFKVAEASIVELDEIVTGETVRNTYRLMGVEWMRGDRVRKI